jgi:Mn-dependent DtxR family transcriptional regulator
MSEEPHEEQREDQHPVSLSQTLGFGAGTFLTVGVIDLVAHLGPTGLVIGGILAYIAAKQGPELANQAREALSSPPARQPEIEEPQQRGKRSFIDRALGRHPESELASAEAAADDTVVVPKEGSENQAHNAADASAMVIYAARDPRLALSLAPGFRPDVNLVLREGIFACGCKGSGKTGVLAKIIEQIMRIAEQVDPARRGIPGVVFDKEGDLLSLLEVLPNGCLADQQHWYSAAEIIEYRLQVVVNLQAWLKDEERAAVIVSLVNDLIRYTSNQEQSKRLPCPVFLDEAQYWLPQESVSYLTRETQRQLIDTFNILLSTGRKRGLTPFIFTQRIAQIDKSTISLGIQIFMRQVIDNDSKRCMDYIRSDVIEDKKRLATLSEGQGVVCLPGGVQLLIQFEERESTHLSHAPTVERVLTHSVQAAPAHPSYHQPALPYQPPAYLAPRSALAEQIAQQPGTALGMPRAGDPQPSLAQAHIGNGSTREADRTPHFTKELGPELQAAYAAYRPGMHHHTLARYLRTTPSLAGQLLKQLQMRGLIDAAGNKTVASTQASQEDLKEYDRAVTVWHELEEKKRANVRDFATAMKMGETKAWDLLGELDRLGLIHWERRKKKDVV